MFLITRVLNLNVLNLKSWISPFRMFLSKSHTLKLLSTHNSIHTVAAVLTLPGPRCLPSFLPGGQRRRNGDRGQTNAPNLLHQRGYSRLSAILLPPSLTLALAKPPPLHCHVLVYLPVWIHYGKRALCRRAGWQVLERIEAAPMRFARRDERRSTTAEDSKDFRKLCINYGQNFFFYLQKKGKDDRLIG